MNNISWPIKENNNEWINILKPNEIASRQKQGPREAIQVFSFGGEDKSWREAARRGRIHRIRATNCSVLPPRHKRKRESKSLCSRNTKHCGFLSLPSWSYYTSPMSRMPHNNSVSMCSSIRNRQNGMKLINPKRSHCLASGI